MTYQSKDESDISNKLQRVSINKSSELSVVYQSFEEATPILDMIISLSLFRSISNIIANCSTCLDLVYTTVLWLKLGGIAIVN